jgi:hypothetical protein
MDILYYIGSGSRHNNDELRYSLRSLDAHCKDVDKVWIVGNKPRFLVNCEYVWVEDIKGEWWKNAFLKTKAAIDAGISKDFLLMNDDFFMLKDFTAKDYPCYHKGDIPETSTSKYYDVICNTRKVLEREGYPFKHYGVHCPMVINGENYLTLEKYYNEPVSARCLYGNIFCKGIKTTDNKSQELKNAKSKCFSSKEFAQEGVFEELNKLFPNPSRWEDENY